MYMKTTIVSFPHHCVRLLDLHCSFHFPSPPRRLLVALHPVSDKDHFLPLLLLIIIISMGIDIIDRARFVEAEKYDNSDLTCIFCCTWIDCHNIRIYTEAHTSASAPWSLVLLLHRFLRPGLPARCHRPGVRCQR